MKNYWIREQEAAKRARRKSNIRSPEDELASEELQDRHAEVDLQDLAELQDREEWWRDRGES